MSGKLLKALHETAQGLHQAGTMDAVMLREFDAQCLPPIKECERLSDAGVGTGAEAPERPVAEVANLVDREGLEALL